MAPTVTYHDIQGYGAMEPNSGAKVPWSPCLFLLSKVIFRSQGPCLYIPPSELVFRRGNDFALQYYCQ